MNARGTTYVTLGKDGFYYRETISSPNRRSPADPAPQQQEQASQSADQIHTADVTELVDSSSAELIKKLNERASTTNPSVLLFVLAGIALVAGFGFIASSNTHVELPSLPGVYRSLQDIQAGSKDDEYSILVARYGQPNKADITQVQTLPIWTATYDLAHLTIQFAPAECTASFESYIANKAASSYLNSSRQHRRKAQEKIPNCSPAIPIHSVIVRYSDSATGEMVGNDVAKQRLEAMSSHSDSQPTISKQQQSPALPFDEGTYSKERQRIDDSGKSSRKPIVIGGISIAAGVVVLILGFVLNGRHRRNQTTHLVYELNETGQQKQKLLEKSINSLGSSQIVWRVISKSQTLDWKRNAGASQLVTRTRVSVNASAPPLVESNITLQCLNLGTIKLYFLPDLILYWENGRFGSIPYDELTSEFSPTRFIEDESLPSDAKQVGQTWRYVKKNGGPDLRFSNNAEIPIMQYGALMLTSSHGMQILLHVSSLQSAQGFSDAIKAFCGKSGPNLPPPSNQAPPRENKAPKYTPSPVVEALRVFGLDANASSAQIRETYIQLAQLYHPDKVAGLGPELQEVAERKMKEINIAYDVLRAH